MNGNVIVVLSLLLLSQEYFVTTVKENRSIFSWSCNAKKETCSKTAGNNNSSNVLYPTVELCRLICGKYGALWPQPTETTELSTQLFLFPLSGIRFVLPSGDDAVTNYLTEATQLFIESFFVEDSSSCQNDNGLSVHLNVTSKELTLNWDTLEAYSLTISTEGKQSVVTISSTTVYGARHALETLSQLIEVYPNSNQEKCLAIVDKARIVDAPIYAHRGLMLDTARNFYSIETIKRNIDGMASSKLNVLHWHVTDSQSFPLEIPNLPNMTKYGAYSSDKIYHAEDVKELVKYAKVRGVRIIIEVDAPSHAGNGWQWGPDAGLGNLAVCINEAPFRSYCIEPPCGQLNPINPNVYKILQTLYGDIIGLLSADDVFHMGGDEVFVPCWKSTNEIITYINNKPRTENTFFDLWGMFQEKAENTFFDLWGMFQEKALEAYDAAAGGHSSSIIIWTSDLTDVNIIEKYLPKNRYVIQTWVPADNSLPKDLLKLGYRIIVSTKDAWYLDHGFWGKTHYHHWETVYDNTIPQGDGTLGGEVCMWGEYVDDLSAEPRIWPRAAAVAERLWSNPKSSSTEAATRFYRHRERLTARGIKAEAVIPRWCYQNERQC